MSLGLADCMSAATRPIESGTGDLYRGVGAESGGYSVLKNRSGTAVGGILWSLLSRKLFTSRTLDVAGVIACYVFEGHVLTRLRTRLLQRYNIYCKLSSGHLSSQIAFLRHGSRAIPVSIYCLMHKVIVWISAGVSQVKIFIKQVVTNFVLLQNCSE